MERHVNYTLIGGIFLACMVCMVIFILWLGHVNFKEEDYLRYVVYTDKDLGGIGANTPINYKGIQIGTIRSVGFDPQHLGIVKIAIDIKSKVPVSKDATLKVESQSLVGLKYLSLIQGKSKEFYSKNDSERILHYEQSFLERLSDSAGHISNEVLGIIKSIDRILSPENINNFGKIIASVQQMAQGLDTTKADLDRLLVKARQTLDRTDTLFAKGDTLLAKGNQLIQHSDQLILDVDHKVQKGQFDLKTILTPLLMQAELSLRNIDQFVQKGSLFMDKFDANPYKTLFGEHK
ncbi:MlaD family protein [Helicobacter salomonis]|uniref:MlaD family protein n=1 Tax=Helicobacter salomonis TaxID=56878 RepID=UPI000CF101AC|nr:MlaD family protein [Helicobacter salomonis]